MAIHWDNLRTFNNSQNNAFEELVCQLAREEQIVNKTEFYRIAAPDGGVEAYCVLNNGDEYGWQAKYFSSMGTTQWNQIKESFETALRTHPNLKKYFICIPLDRQDPRHGEQMWFMDRWNKKVEQWTEFAQAQGREISFEYWGSSELIHRLSQEKHAGRTLFWFSQEEFLDVWFKSHVETSIENLGKRYTPEVHVKLGIEKEFDSISKNDSFRQYIKEEFHEFLLRLNKVLSRLSGLSGLPIHDEVSEIRTAKDDIVFQFSLSQKKEILQIDVTLLEKSMWSIKGALSKCVTKIDKYKKESKESKESKDINDYSDQEINKLWNALYNFSNFIQSSSLKLANCPNALLCGPAGIGKSHLLADIASTKLKENKSCILLLGQHFTSEESPWTQILRNLLRVQCSESEFLGVLNAKAEAQGERLLFIIDAINEGRGKYFWPEHINGFVNDFKKYPWIGLVLSIRSSYECLLIPDNFVSDNKVIKLNHSGFENIEYSASNFFFSQYDIEQPSVPLLHPEFSNPLFLKLFCEGLYRSGLNKIPKGYGGISSIIDFFLESIDYKLSKPSFFDYPSGRKVVRKVIDGLIEYRLKNDLNVVAYEVAFEIADSILSKFSNKRRFIDALISEGVLSKNIFRSGEGAYEEAVYLAYERFEDHLITSYLLDNHLDSDNPETVFQSSGKLARYIDNSHVTQGVLESLSIQIPERTGIELYQLLDDQQKAFTTVKESFINSLIWRKPETIKECTKEYVQKYILRNKHSFNLFFQMVYSVSTDPDHIYNANSLHDYLMKFTLAERDGFWTIYLHDQDHEGTAMTRLITWANANNEKAYLSEESRILAAKALAWLFTTTNVLFRDSATDALVVLLENNLATIMKLLIEFEDINDPYVYERIFAAAYGAVLRSDNLEELEHLSQYIIERIFNKEEVYPNVLVRDYARNIVEYALYRGLFDLGNLDLVRPPYKSSFPSEFPTNEEIDVYIFDYDADDFKDYYWGQNSILSSMVTEYGRGTSSYGDFGRYTFQNAIQNWEDFDPNDLSNYACKLIFEKYGYDVEKHGKFDRNATRGDRARNIVERIGKKYQWIALYEVLALLSDNNKIPEESSSLGKEVLYAFYQGPWEPFVRNIDPTVVRDQSKIQFQQEKLISHVDYSDWDDANEAWLVKDENLPECLIAVTDSCNDEWLVLEDHLSWEEPVPIGQDKHEYPRKRLWYQIRSYLVKEEAADYLIDWLKDQNFMGRWFPEGRDQYQVFSREFYWSPAYRFFNNPIYGGHSWEEVHDREKKKIIAHVLPTTEGHRWESGTDYEDQPSYLAPREYMYTGMKLQYSKNIGEWLDEKGHACCFDDSIKTGKSSCLLIRKDILQKFLTENGLIIFWTRLGEKTINGTSFSRQRYLKWLELSGVYILSNGKIYGETNSFIQDVKGT